MQVFLLGQKCELKGERMPSHMSTYSLDIGIVSAVYKKIQIYWLYEVVSTVNQCTVQSYEFQLKLKDRILLHCVSGRWTDCVLLDSGLRSREDVSADIEIQIIARSSRYAEPLYRYNFALGLMILPIKRMESQKKQATTNAITTLFASG